MSTNLVCQLRSSTVDVGLLYEKRKQLIDWVFNGTQHGKVNLCQLPDRETASGG